MHVGLFTKRFLEPTHYAIAQILQGVPVNYSVFAREYLPGIADSIKTLRRETFVGGPLSARAIHDIDIFHVIFDGKGSLSAFTSAVDAGLPTIVSFHGGFDTNVLVERLEYREPLQEMARRAAALTVVGPTDAFRLKRHGIEGKVIILPVPIDTAALPNPQPRPGRLVVVGRLVSKKGIDIAITALSHLPTAYVLDIVGAGPDESALRSLSIRLGVEKRITWHGMLPLHDTLIVMARAQICVHAARVATDGNAEGTPQSVLYALSLGLPIIATRTGSIPDVVTHLGNGLLVAQDDPEAVAESVLQLVGGNIPLHRNSDIEPSDSLRDVMRVRERVFEIYASANAQT